MGYDGHHNAPVTPGLPSPRGGATPWRDQDYDYPASVGPVRQFTLYKILLHKYFNYFIFYYYFCILGGRAAGTTRN